MFVRAQFRDDHVHHFALGGVDQVSEAAVEVGVADVGRARACGKELGFGRGGGCGHANAPARKCGAIVRLSGGTRSKRGYARSGRSRPAGGRVKDLSGVEDRRLDLFTLQVRIAFEELVNGPAEGDVLQDQSPP